MTAPDPFGIVGTELDGRIAIVAAVGYGGYGVVYRAHHFGLDEPVAVKMLKTPPSLSIAERAEVLARLRGEAKLLHRLSRKSVGIVQALDVGDVELGPSGWAPYLVMEWLEGQPLDEELKRRRGMSSGGRTLREGLELLGSALDALAIGHRHNVAHLDLKPANIFLCSEAEPAARAKVLDFGVAKVLGDGSPTLTGDPSEGGSLRPFTPQYAAPEQFDRRHGAVGPATDVFALALILLEVMSDQPFLKGDTPLQLYMSAVNELARPPLSSIGIEPRSALGEALRRALAAHASHRFPDAAAFHEALRRAAKAGPLRPAVAASADPHEPASAAATAATAASVTGQNRFCTIVALELWGTASLDERLDPDEVARAIERCLEAPRRIFRELGADVEELVGGRLVAVFGLASEDANAAEQAVLATLRCREAVERFPPPGGLPQGSLAIRAGVESGRAYVGPGRAARLAGAPLSVANDLQDRASAGAILLGPDASRLVAGKFELSQSPEDGTPSALSVRGIAPARRDLEAIARMDFLGAPTRFVGRDRELGHIVSGVERVIDAHGDRGASSYHATIVGERGSGKSRFLSEIGRRLERDGFLVLAAAGHMATASESYGVIASLVRGWFHIHEDDPWETATRKIERGLADLATLGAARTAPRASRRRGGASVNHIAPALLRVLGLGAVQAHTLAEDHERVGPGIVAALSGMLGLADRPCAILCDDATWADRASLRLLGELGARLDQPSCVLLTGPRELGAELANDAGPASEIVVLESMTRPQLVRMAMDRMARVSPRPRALCDRLAERAEGNPLALVEMIHLLIDGGAIDTRDEPWSVDETRVQDLGLPTSIQALVQARLDRVGGLGLEVLCHAAVIGDSFWSGAVATLMDRPVAELTPIIADLTARQLVQVEANPSFPGEQEHRFGQTSTREVAYPMLLQATRRKLHLRAARWLEARRPGDAMAGRIAVHYERAGASAAAGEAYLAAGRHAASLGRADDALAMLARGLDLERFAEEPDAQSDAMGWGLKVGLHFERGNVLRHAGRLAKAEDAYEAAASCIVDDGSQLEPSIHRARIAYRLAMVAELRGEIGLALEQLELGVQFAERAGLDVERAQMMALRAAIALRNNENAESERACLEGLRILRRIEERGPRFDEAVERLLRTLGGSLYRRGRFRGAERCYLQALRAIDERELPHLASRVHNNIAAARYARGDVASAGESFARALELSESGGDMVVVMTALANLGEVDLALGRVKEAVENLEEAVAIGERLGAPSDLADVYRNLASAHHGQKDFHRAQQAADKALDLALTPGGQVYLDSVVGTLIPLYASFDRDVPRQREEAWQRAAARLEPGSPHHAGIVALLQRPTTPC